MSPKSRRVAGAILIVLPTVMIGGVSILTLLIGTPEYMKNPLRQDLWRAGHAHAGVLVILGLVCLLLTGATALTGFWAWLAGTGVLVAAILMSAGFFFSAMGRGRERPNRAVILLGVGAVLLAAGVATLGVGLLLG